MEKGIVKWFDAEKGFGFIERECGLEDVFVYLQDINMEGYKYLNENEEVTFEVVPDKRGGAQAKNVTPTVKKKKQQILGYTTLSGEELINEYTTEIGIKLFNIEFSIDAMDIDEPEIRKYNIIAFNKKEAIKIARILLDTDISTSFVEPCNKIKLIKCEQDLSSNSVYFKVIKD